MIPFIICSGVFLLIYSTLLAKERMFAFNRLYLLLTLALSLIIPYISLEFVVNQKYNTIPNATQWIEQATSPLTKTAYLEPKQQLNYWAILYGMVTTLLVFRFAISLRRILLLIKKNEKITTSGTTFVLLHDSISPASFFHYVFVNKADYLENKIPQEVLFHEKEHGRLKHTLDILLLEIVQIVAWFNPFVYLYKQAIQLNHEFEVDQKVVRYYGSAKHYQYLLINQAADSSKLIHSFNFIHIKKRILMITRNSQPSVVFAKAILSTSIVLAVSFLFTEKSFAQEIKKQAEKAVPIQMRTLELTSKDLDEFDVIATKALTHSSKNNEYQFTEDEVNAMGDIYMKMSNEEKSKQKLTLLPRDNSIYTAKKPTPEEFENFKNPKLYGVWIDGKRIKNQELSKYQVSDFAHFWTSNLSKTAKHYGQYKYHLELFTPKEFEKNGMQWENDKRRYVIFYKPYFYKLVKQKIS
jgi:bla regulator protein BlaR1